MINLNLLSPAKREEVKLKKIYLIIKNITEIFLVFIILIAIILLSSKYVLQKKFNEAVAQTTLIAGTHRELDLKIKTLNTKLENISKIQNEFIQWSKILKHFSQITPQAIEINSLVLNGDKKTAEIKGRAQVRENLLIFEKNLKDSEIFTEIESPITNILLKENVSFQFTTKLDLEKVK